MSKPVLTDEMRRRFALAKRIALAGLAIIFFGIGILILWVVWHNQGVAGTDLLMIVWITCVLGGMAVAGGGGILLNGLNQAAGISDLDDD